MARSPDARRARPRRRAAGRHRRAARDAALRAGLALLALVALTLAPAAIAAAHAVLSSTAPADGQTLPAPPLKTGPTFVEPVGATHVVGAGLGLRGLVEQGLVERPLAGSDDTGMQVAAAAVRWVLYAATLLAAGGLAFLAFAHDRRADERGPLARVVVGAAIVAAVGSVAAVGLQAALATGLGAAAIADPQVVGTVLASGLGASALLRLAGLACVTAAAGRLWERWAVATGSLGAAVAAASFLLEGHTATTTPRWLVIGADLTHTVAAAVWFGGLVLLAATLRRRRSPDDAVGGGALVARFSAMATWAVAAVSVGGLALAWAEVRAARALVSTAYGWTLLLKVAVVAAVLGVAGYNNRRLVPAIRRAGAGAWERLRTTVCLEVAGIVAVLLVTAVLVNLTPARTEAGVTGPLPTPTGMGD